MSSREPSPFKPDVLAGKVALITGGGSGIGYAIALQYGLHGAKVVITGRRAEFLDRAVAAFKEFGVDGARFAGDVRSFEDCEKAVQFTVEKYGRLDLVVCSAAGNFLAVSEALSPGGFRTVMEIDVVGVFNTCRAAFPHLKASKGSIINISATLHYGANWWQVAPSAAKAAIDAMTRNLALEWGEYGIRVNAIAPGPIADTPGTTKLTGDIPQKALDAALKRSVPVGRLGTKMEIATSALFLSLNQYISGEILVVDGGQWFGSPALFPRSAVLKVSKGVEGKSRKMGGAELKSKL